jgi:DNA (cytosine-5)-methyltransferase 1
MRYLSVCSGIEAATVAWHPLGWEAAAFSEIDAFPRAVLQHHYPDTPLHGDFTTIQSGQYGPVDLLVGGTPCQSFSVAGLRLGLDDPRGNLALGFAQLAARLHPRWIVWENVPGVLSANGGRDFGAILGAMAELGYSFAYRVLDAQHFGVPQRRRRVFLVGHSSGDWRRPAAVLLEPQGVSGNSAESSGSAQKTDRCSAAGLGGCSDVAQCLTTGTGMRYDPETETLIPEGDAVRRLTPIECERLQGFPDRYTEIPWKNKPAASCPDGPRYNALGNSMAVPVMAWIGSRIAAVDALDGQP